MYGTLAYRSKYLFRDWYFPRLPDQHQTSFSVECSTVLSHQKAWPELPVITLNIICILLKFHHTSIVKGNPRYSPSQALSISQCQSLSALDDTESNWHWEFERAWVTASFVPRPIWKFDLGTRLSLDQSAWWSIYWQQQLTFSSFSRLHSWGGLKRITWYFLPSKLYNREKFHSTKVCVHG